MGMQLNVRLCEFIGALIGDGFHNMYQAGHYVIQFTGDLRLDYAYYNQTIMPSARILFDNINPYIIRKGNTLRINFMSKRLFCMLKNRFRIPQGKKAYSVRIPEEILNSNDRLLIYATIRGIFDTDGCIYFDERLCYKKPYPRITLQISNKGLFHQLKEILKKDFTLYASARTKRKFYIEIYGHQQLDKWLSLIGFSNPRHLDKIHAPMAQPGRAQK